MSIFRRTILTGVGFAGLALQAPDAHAAAYQVYLNSTCGTSLICVIDFPDVPLGKRLTISNVSCYLRFDSDASIYGLQLLQMTKGGSIGMAVTLVPQQIGITADGTAFDKVAAANHVITAFASSGEHFRIYAQITKGASYEQLACHISGQITN